MDREKAKEYLRQYRTNEKEVRRLEGEIARWESQAQKVTAKAGGSVGTGSGDSMVQVAVEEIQTLIEELSCSLSAAVAMRRSIEEAINSVGQQGHLKLLLRYRYINGYTFERIAVVMDYSYRQVLNLHDVALDKVKKIA